MLMERAGAGLSRETVDAVGAHHQVVRPAQDLERRGLFAVVDRDSRLLASIPKDREQPAAADRGECMTTGCEDVTSIVDVDVVPDRKVLGQPFEESAVGLLDADQRLVGENDAEPERVVRRISLPDLDPMIRIEELDQGRQV